MDLSDSALSQPKAQGAADIFRALADATRVNVLMLLADRPYRAIDLAESLRIRRTSLFAPIKYLHLMGAIEPERAGKHVSYRLLDRGMEMVKLVEMAVGDQVTESVDLG
jgi:DNA-binding transcriptional ArsR family regulator